jgi:hypothetical protein
VKVWKPERLVWLYAFSRTDLGKVMLPAVIGALFASSAFLLQFFFITKPSEAKAYQRSLIEQKLTRIYGPLTIYITARGDTLSTALADDTVLDNIMSNYHLLSPELQRILSEYLGLFRGSFKHPEVKMSDVDKAINVEKEFRDQLKKEMAELSTKFEQN